MFNPKSFKVRKPTSLTLCNSAHQLASRSNMVARPVPNLEDTFYVVGNDNSWCATIDDHARTVGVYMYGKEELKRRLDAKEFLGEVVDIPTTDKYIGNVICRELAILEG